MAGVVDGYKLSADAVESMNVVLTSGGRTQGKSLAIERHIAAMDHLRKE